MKRIAFVVTVLLLVACQKEKKGYHISADTVGFENGTMVYVNAISQSNRPVIIDSTTVENGKIELALPSPESNDFNYLTFKDIPGNVLFLAENNAIEMTVYKDSLRSSIVKGGSENQLFFKYLTTVQKFGEQKIEFDKQYQVAVQLGEKDKLQKINDDKKVLIEKEKQFRRDILENNSNSLVSVMALTDLVNIKGIPAKEAQEKFASIKDTLKTTRLGKNLNTIISSAVATASQKRIDVGVEVDDFSAPTPSGKTLSLKEAMGKITIIEFWASWCKPCRIENPNLVKAYNKYHDKGLNIIGVSLDRKQDAWTRAIEADNLSWNHVSNLQFWQEPIAKAYGVRSIPASFIIDEKGNVLAKNLRGAALEQKISELLEQKSL